ncbi:Uncharacterised protein [Providencia alcalifaciens]|uniref:Uncharacterized protein n=1 Tax=Providencia alcalifaciens DSM 30120 TaxID=520999 RepID=B6XGR5_9GAMM|nr:hypothetical protein [Providencia alcalifaciens]EEB45462.1 hypothetical protein PROVALCAL_02551 [Providencia alcalifaciens DSM 30120]SQI34770.1 Uncharacterised protein [Providencia alcalifaciens]
MTDKAEVKELMLADISFRDYLATEAMASIPVSLDDNEQKLIANSAYRMADAMLKARG